MTQINLKQLKTFLAVVRYGGVCRAAECLNLTQPAVTTRIKNLEATLSAALFVRSSRSLQLTKRGELLVHYAEQFEQLSAQLERDVVDPNDLVVHLRIGASETIVQCWLPELISRLHDLYPNILIEIHVDNSSNLRHSLLKNEIDLALLLGPVSNPNICNIDLPSVDISWYMSAKQLHLTNLEQLYTSMPVITYAKNTRPFQELKHMLFERVGPGVILFPSSSLSACFRMVEANLGVAALPRLLGNPLVAAGTIQEFDPGWLPNPLHFTASFSDNPPSHVTRTAAEMALQVATAYTSRHSSPE